MHKTLFSSKNITKLRKIDDYHIIKIDSFELQFDKNNVPVQ